MTNAEAVQAHGAPADLELAHRLADHADAIAARHFATGGIGWQTKSDGSPVTAADREIEHAVRGLINQARADDAFLGEEFGAHGHSRRRWIVDAIDGTASFLAGEPEWGTLIALTDGDAVSLGVVTAPACQTRWWAARGSGAWSTSLPLDHAAAPTRLAVTTATDLHDAAIGIWPPPARLDTRDRQRAANLAARARTTLPALDWHSTTPPTTTVGKPSTGSGTCHGGLLVATGKLDAFLLQGVGTWDIAALIPIVEEAGGIYSDLSDDQPGDTRTALFSAPALHEEILEIAARTT
jgi:histidinol-phosphatase